MQHMQRSTADQLHTLFTSLLETEVGTPAENSATPVPVLLEQLSALGMLERLVKVALQESVTELRREKVTWSQIGETFGSSLQSAHGRWH